MKIHKIEKKNWNSKVVDAIILEIIFNENDYSLPEIRDEINAASLNTEFLIENRKIKDLLIENMGRISILD